MGAVPSKKENHNSACQKIGGLDGERSDYISRWF